MPKLDYANGHLCIHINVCDDKRISKALIINSND